MNYLMAKKDYFINALFDTYFNKDRIGAKCREELAKNLYKYPNSTICVVGYHSLQMHGIAVDGDKVVIDCDISDNPEIDGKLLKYVKSKSKSNKFDIIQMYSTREFLDRVKRYAKESGKVPLYRFE